ncbi:MAG: hypothetical protein Q7J73_10395, partial [Dehalococcoidales bacterium]|nr:hypothetical protein [Dehalococcoidales bacterium]
VAGSNTPVFFIGDSGTSSPFLVANVNGRIGIATSTLGQSGVQGIGLSVATSTYIAGGLSVGRSATTSSGGLMAGIADISALQVRSLVSCTADIETDADGVLRCGTAGAAGAAGNDFDVQFNDAGTMAGLSSLTFNKTTGLLLSGGDISLLGSDLNFSNGVSGAATATISGQYGKLGFATTAPFGQFSIEADNSVVGSNTPIFVVGDSGSSSPFIYVSGVNGNVGIGSTSPSSLLSIEQTGGQNAFSIGSSSGMTLVVNEKGFVGVGADDPVIPFQVKTGGGNSNPSVFASSIASFQRNPSTGSIARVQIISGSNAQAILNLGNNTSNDGGGFIYDGSDSTMSLAAGDVQLLDVLSGAVRVHDDLFILGSDLNIGNGITATSTFSGSYGKLGLSSTTPWGQFSLEVSGVPGSTTPIFVIGDSGTSSPIFIANVNGRIGIATNTVDQYGVLGIGLSVATNTYIAGGLSIGRTATTSSGGLMAGIVDFQYGQIRNLISCDTVDTDADGVLRCGTDNAGAATAAGNDFDIQFNDAGTTAGLSSLTFNKTTGLLLSGGDISLLGSDLNFSNGVSGAATATISGQYGKLGFGTTSPYAQFSIDPSAVSGSTTPIFVIGSSGSSSPIISINWGGVIGIGTNTPAGAEELNGFGLAIATNTLLSGTLTVSSTATSTFNGGIYVKENGGITSASGLIVSAGRVGIGLATPERLVEILGTGESASLLRVRNNTDGINAVLDIHNDG